MYLGWVQGVLVKLASTLSAPTEEFITHSGTPANAVKAPNAALRHGLTTGMTVGVKVKRLNSDGDSAGS